MGKSFTEDPKGNGKKGGLQAAQNYRDNLDWLFGEGKEDFKEYARKQAILRKGEELTKPELLWMEKLEKNLEFKFPKLARKEVSLDGDLNINNINNATDEELKKLAGVSS